MQYEKILSNYQTPFYAFDISVLRKRIDYIKSSIPANVDLCYAVKANTFIIKEAEPLVERLEVCSPGEFEVCEFLDVPMEKIVVSGVYKTPSFIERIIRDYDNVGVYTAESLTQYYLVKSLAHKYNRPIEMLVRVTSKNQFGMSESDLFEIINDNKSDELIKIVGIQYFSSTQRTSLKKFKREFEYLNDLIARLKNDYSFDVEELEYGTGFPVFYFQSDSFDEDAYFSEFSAMMTEMLPSDIKITFEVGRSIAASCGYYFTSVVDSKVNKVGNFAILDGGINHIVYYGQSMAMKFPHIDLYPARECTNTKEWNLCGSLCTVNDIIVKALPLDDLKIGDVLVFKNTGAYCMCEGTSLFLTRELPGVVIVDGDNYTLVRDNYKTSNLNRPNY